MTHAPAARAAPGRDAKLPREPDDSRLRLRANPLRLTFSASPWRAAGYLATYLLLSGILFSLALTVSVTAAVLSLTVVAAPLLIAAAAVVHGCAAVGRGMLRQVFTRPVGAGDEQREPVPGIWARARASWRGRTWRETALLIGLWAPLFALDTVVFAIWLFLLAGVTMPLWYWTPSHSCVGYCVSNAARGVELGSFPHGPHGPGAQGLYVDTLPKALLAAAGFVILFLLFNYVLVSTALMHGRVTRSLLRPAADPLAEAKNVLARPGPLGPLSPPIGTPADPRND